VLAPDLGIRGAHVVANRQFYAEDHSGEDAPAVPDVLKDSLSRSSGGESTDAVAFFAVGLAAAVIGLVALYKSSM
jgi:hypothetical protein